MFTGIGSAIGRVEVVSPNGGTGRGRGKGERGVAEVVRRERRGDAWVYDLRVPAEVREIAIPHGSITLDGVSLTINALPGPDLVQIALIPFTREHTTLGALRVGARVHVEGDVLGKYVRQLCRTTP